MYQLSDVVQTRQLRDAYGDDIILYDEREQSVVYQLEAEFIVGKQAYAVLQKENKRKDEEAEIFRVTAGASGELELETIDDDDEWEAISELYDEMTFPADEQ